MKNGLFAGVLFACTLLTLGTSVMAADVWTKDSVKLTIARQGTGAVTNDLIAGLYYDTDDDATVSDDTLYIPLETVFGDKGFAAVVGIPWSIRDGLVYFMNGNLPVSLGVTNHDGQAYVLALDAIRNLPVNGTLINNGIITLSVW